MFLFDNQLIREDNYSKPCWRPRTALCGAGTEWQPELLSVTSASHPACFSRNAASQAWGMTKRTQTLPKKSRGPLIPSEKVSAVIMDGLWSILLQKRDRPSGQKRWKVQQRSPGGELKDSIYLTRKEDQEEPWPPNVMQQRRHWTILCIDCR